RIRIIPRHLHGIYIPINCRQCEDAPCMTVCPREAISRDLNLGRIIIDYHRCISCRMCVSACPFGAMGYDHSRHRVFKCDLCNGDPQCVRFCFPGSLSYEKPENSNLSRLRQSASNLIVTKNSGFKRR
ncbi:MAG: 4Fe-4S dicluster domain-containing protein, partial [Thermodesulfobacteriota bacterium]